MVLNGGWLDSIDRRVAILEYDFVGADLTSNGSIDTNAEPDTEPVAAATTATADATTTDTQCNAAGGVT